MHHRFGTTALIFLALCISLTGCGAAKSIYAFDNYFNDRNSAENDRPVNDLFATELAQRFGAMALFSQVVYRDDLKNERQSNKDKTDCELQPLERFGLPDAGDAFGRWYRLADIEAPSGVDVSVGCLDDRGTGLFYETYVFKNTDGRFLEAVIAYRGTENDKGQFISDWKTNLTAFFGFEPEQYEQARMTLPKLIETLHGLNPPSGGKDFQIQIFATGHSLGGGLAQQAGYVSKHIEEVITFNTSPVTNWSALRIAGEIENNYPSIFRIYHTGEILDQVRQTTTAFTTSRFGRYDIGIQLEPKSLGRGHSMQVIACDFARRLAEQPQHDRGHTKHYYPARYAKIHVLENPIFCG